MNTLDKLQKAFPESYRKGNVLLINADCMDVMKLLDDKEFCLACVDPPYGIKRAKTQTLTNEYVSNGKGYDFKIKSYKEKEWDNETPTSKYWDELFRVSKNQIIWGANYFIKELPHFKNFIYWHKKGKSNDKMFNEGEMAFVSIGRSVMVDIWWNGVGVIHSKEYRFHPTQKPVALYEWLLTNYAKKGQKVLDTHLGSGSSAIAAHYFGVDFVGCELDKDYFEAAKARFDMATKQLAMSI